MNARGLFVAGAIVLIAGCSQGPESKANEAASANESAKAKHPTYCFFKDANTKDWSADRDASGNVSLKGKARVDDNRYAAEISQPEVSGVNATVWLTMGQNTGAYGAPDNWWDVKATVPDSASVEAVTVMCGTKTVAELKVPAGD